MKKFAACFVAVMFVSSLAGTAALVHASDEKSLVSKSDLKKDEEARQALRKKIMAKKDEINGSSWEVEIKSQSGKGSYLGKDTLTFQNEKFRSAVTEKNGYSSTNYTLTVSEDDKGPTIWETMQTTKDGQVTFWRGEWKDEAMSGVISRQLKDGNEDYYFASSGRTVIPKTVEVESDETGDVNVNAQEETPQAESAVTSLPAGTVAASVKSSGKPAASGDPKKKSWFF